MKAICCIEAKNKAAQEMQDHLEKKGGLDTVTTD